MINVKNGLVDVKGTYEELLNDLSSVSGCLRDLLKSYRNEEQAQEKIMLAVERGFLIDEKLDNEKVLEMQKLTEKINGR